jgi:DNA-directed RNA polymerase specialized sigma24 family protein
MKTDIEQDYINFKPIVKNASKFEIRKSELFDDFYHNVFFNLLKFPEKYKEIENKKNYLVKAVYNQWRNHYTVNKKYVYDQAALTFIIENTIDEITSLYEKYLIDWDLIQHVQYLVSEYPEKQREMIIAKISDIKIPGNYDSNKTNYRLALLKLKKDMQHLK